MEEPDAKKKQSVRATYILGIVGGVLTIILAFAVIYFGEWVRSLTAYGYLGAFFISILGGVTIIIPVPMLAVVFALGGVMRYPWLVGLSAALGETVAAIVIYFTGYSGGRAIQNAERGLLLKAYDRLMVLMERRGSLTLFLLSSLVNPFFYPAALAAGALRFGGRKYFAICFVGKTIKCMSVVYAGYWGIKELLNFLGISL